MGKEFKELPRRLQRWIKSGKAETKRKSGPVKVLTAEEILALYPQHTVADHRVSAAKSKPTNSTVLATNGLTVEGGVAEKDCHVAVRCDTGRIVNARQVDPTVKSLNKHSHGFESVRVPLGKTLEDEVRELDRAYLCLALGDESARVTWPSRTQRSGNSRDVRAGSPKNRPGQTVAASIEPTVRPGPTRATRLSKLHGR